MIRWLKALFVVLAAFVVGSGHAVAMPMPYSYDGAASVYDLATPHTWAGSASTLHRGPPDSPYRAGVDGRDSILWVRVAANTAEGAADSALAAGRTSGAAAELNAGGQVITDRSTGGASRSLNPAVQAALDDVPMLARAPWHGACAEMGCLSQAIDRGINPSGGSIRAVASNDQNLWMALGEVT